MTTQSDILGGDNMRVAVRIVLSSLLLMAWSHSLLSGFQASAWVLVVYLLTGGQYTFYLIWGSLLRDLRYIRYAPFYCTAQSKQRFLEILKHDI